MKSFGGRSKFCKNNPAGEINVLLVILSVDVCHKTYLHAESEDGIRRRRQSVAQRNEPKE